jgi:putative addiction module component (TIGR02574 family)
MWCRDCGVTYAAGMSRTLEQIEDEVLRLPEESRARLMERLLASFQAQAGSDEEGIARAWAEEALRRDDEMSSGSEKGVPAEEVFSKLRSRR